HGLAGQSVTEQQVVCSPDGGGSVTPSGRVHPGSVPQEAGAPRLVDGDPAVYPVAESPMQEVGVLGEAGSGVAGGPAARVLQWLDRKSTRLNSSHVKISYAVFCL